MSERMVSDEADGRLWEAWDLYSSTGHLDDEHRRVIDAYVDGRMTITELSDALGIARD